MLYQYDTYNIQLVNDQCRLFRYHARVHIFDREDIDIVFTSMQDDCLDSLSITQAIADCYFSMMANCTELFDHELI